MRKRLWIILRIVLGLGLISVVLFRINFWDEVRLADGRKISGHILTQKPDRLEIKDRSGKVHSFGPVEMSKPKFEVRRGFFTILKGIKRGLALITFLSIGSIFVIASFRWRMLLKVQGVTLGFFRIFHLTMMGLFFNNFMPGLTGGDFVKAYYVSRETHKKTEAITTVFLDRAVGLFALSILATVMVLVNITRPEFRAASIVVYAFLLMGILAAVTLYSQRVRRRLAGRLGRISFLERALSFIPIKRIARDIDRALILYKNHKRAVLLAMLFSFFAHCVAILANFGYGQALGLKADIGHYFLLFPIIAMISSFPVLPAGWGVGEAAYVFGFGLVGVPATQAITLSLVYRISHNIFWGLPGGVMFMASPRRLTRREMAAELSSDAQG